MIIFLQNFDSEFLHIKNFKMIDFSVMTESFVIRYNMFDINACLSKLFLKILMFYN